MKVFAFDLLPYGEHLNHLKEGQELPWPLGKRHFRPQVAARTYAEHLDAWELMDQLGFDGVGFNEHHTSPYGLMTSPNLMAAAASQRTHQLKLLIYGNLLPIDDLKNNNELAWGTSDEVRDKLIAEAEALGTDTLLLSFNRGAMPHSMFMAQLERFGADVLPALKAYQVDKVPV